MTYKQTSKDRFFEYIQEHHTVPELNTLEANLRVDYFEPVFIAGEHTFKELKAFALYSPREKYYIKEKE